MRTMTYSESRAKYAETLSAVVDDREEVVITRAGHEPVVIVSLDDYESLKETASLLKNPANARRLLGSIDRLEAGRSAGRWRVPSTEKTWSTGAAICSRTWTVTAVAACQRRAMLGQGFVLMHRICSRRTMSLSGSQPAGFPAVTPAQRICR